jgi:oligo-alginate lyase
MTTLPKFRCMTLILSGFLLMGISLPISAEDVALVNPGFEEELKGWDIIKVDKGKSTLSTGAARSGKYGIAVDDGSITEGSEVFSDLISVTEGKDYTLRFWGRIVSGTGMGVYLIFYDTEQKIMATVKENSVPIPDATGDWQEVVLEVVAPKEAKYAAVRLHSFGAAIVQAHLDDFSLVTGKWK